MLLVVARGLDSRQSQEAQSVRKPRDWSEVTKTHLLVQFCICLFAGCIRIRELSESGDDISYKSVGKIETTLVFIHL